MPRSLQLEKQNMKGLPPQFSSFVTSLVKEVESIEGFLSPNEIRFLALLAACPTTKGEILEIGSFKGKSTVVLAKAAALTLNPKVVAVDPMTAPSITDPDLKNAASSLADFQANLRQHNVAEQVEFHCTFSHELAKTWVRPLRLLWIDADHTYQGTKQDLDLFAPHLADGAIVSFHDVLHEFEGGIRVFMEDILLHPQFGRVGMCGSLGWAQFHADADFCRSYADQKLQLYKRLSRLIPYVVFKNELNGWEKKKYKLLRARVPHGAIDPAKWLQSVTSVT
jgi:predicted O-methyltransferase YrrM